MRSNYKAESGVSVVYSPANPVCVEEVEEGKNKNETHLSL